MLTVIAAMEQELAGVKRLLKAVPVASVELHVIGIGKEQAESNIHWSCGRVLRPAGAGTERKFVVACRRVSVYRRREDEYLHIGRCRRNRHRKCIRIAACDLDQVVGA